MDPKQQALTDKLEANIRESAAEIDKLKAKAAVASAVARRQMHEELDNLRDKKREAEERLKQLKESTGEAWDDMKSSAEEAWDSLVTGLKRAKEHF